MGPRVDKPGMGPAEPERGSPPTSHSWKGQKLKSLLGSLVLRPLTHILPEEVAGHSSYIKLQEEILGSLSLSLVEEVVLLLIPETSTAYRIIMMESMARLEKMAVLIDHRRVLEVLVAEADHPMRTATEMLGVDLAAVGTFQMEMVEVAGKGCHLAKAS